MSNDDAPNNQTPPLLNEANKPRGCLALLGGLSGTTRIRILGMEIDAPLGIVLALFLGLLVAYAAILLWVIPKHVVVLSDPLIDAALTAQPTPTAQPPLPRLVIVDKYPQNTQYCVQPGEKVYLRIEPTPDPTKTNYKVDALGTMEITKGRDSGMFFTIEGKKAGDPITLILYEVNSEGVIGRPISDARFSVQEVCK
jgi:hypothetical protein